MDNIQPSIALFQNLGWPEIVIILVLFVFLFGAKKLPELARGLGKSIKEFKKATSNIEDEVRTAIEEEDRKQTIEKKEKERAPAKE